jgi:hypothetical protein
VRLEIDLTGRPMRTASTGMRGRSDISRRPDCSSSSTMATAYGTSRPGIQAWWLMEKPTTLPRPETSSGAIFAERQAGQRAA